MDLALSKEIEELRFKVGKFVREQCVPLESDSRNFDENENIDPNLLSDLRKKAKSSGLWAPQVSKELGGMGLSMSAQAVIYEEAAYSIFGPLALNCAAPDDGNMRLLMMVGTDYQKERWLKPIIDGKVNSSFVMTEPHPGAGSDPAGMMLTKATKSGDKWIINGKKWFITGAGVAQHFMIVARTSDDPRRGLSCFLFDRDQPGWNIIRKIPIMGPEEHGGHCELEFDGLEVSEKDVLMEIGDGLRVTQIRLGPARLTHCMRWIGMSRRAMDIAADYIQERKSFGKSLSEHEGVQWMLGESAMRIHLSRLTTMYAAYQLDKGEKARKEISMAKVQVADTLNNVIDTCIQLCGAKGYSKDTLLEWMYRYARSAKLVDGASEVHKMVLSRTYMKERQDFWKWPIK
tara:strand:+ start:21983 stop:23188 length:1206 start_codon:yes stop_codon:yes gene_type:complete